MQEHHINKKKIGLGLMFVSFAWFVQTVAYAQSDAEIRESVRACQRMSELSFRLACYDSAFPPLVGTVDSDDSMASGEEPVAEEPATSLATLEQQLEAERQQLEAERRQIETERQQIENAQQIESTAQIVEVQQPNMRTSRFITADGRVFVQRNATRINRLPETPFDVEIEYLLAGSTIFVIPGPGDQRIRVLLED